MGGLFGVISKEDCVSDLFYGTDYHSHLGTTRGGLAVKNPEGFIRFIHNIENAQFRSKFEQDITKMHSTRGIGVISDYDNQPLLIRSHLGKYAIVTVGAIKNADELVKKVFSTRIIHFSEMIGEEINPTELVASLINQELTFEEGIINAQEAIEGSCSLLLLTDKGVYAARDRLGRTPVVLGEKEGSLAVTLETCAFPNLGFKIKKYLGPGEIVLITEEGIEQKKPPGEKMQICGFLWVYYGYPASSYEGLNVESVRNKCGAKLAKNDSIKIDMVAGLPDSGIGHGLGYASEAGIPFKRPFVKYTPTWARSFMPQDQTVRDIVAKMKLIPISELIKGKKLLLCEDSIVRGTQLKNTIQRLYDFGALEVHMRPACPPLTHGCKFLNFSRSKSELDLAARKAIKEIEGVDDKDLDEYSTEDSEKHKGMIKQISQMLKLTTLKYQKLADLVEAIGLPKEKICTYCWDGAEIK
ncbi:MAG: amidophosphoribosyltransferase [Candidatus Aminicenantes bacterium]|nr:amidophosphoribosyltransferase [Candidatus Aminicenantes bacterium]